MVPARLRFQPLSMHCLQATTWVARAKLVILRHLLRVRRHRALAGPCLPGSSVAPRHADCGLLLNRFISVQDEEQQQLWYHGLRASISKFKNMSTGSSATAQLAGVARAASAAQRWKAVRCVRAERFT